MASLTAGARAGRHENAGEGYTLPNYDLRLHAR
jgi:hypothetical protein